MNKKISLILGLLFLPAIFFGTAQLVFATEIGGNTLDTVRGVEFQVQGAQSTLPGSAVPAYFLELVQGMGIKLSPAISSGVPNDSPYNFALFGLRGIGSLLDGWLRFNDTAGSEGFQWSSDGTTWNAFGGSITGGDCPAGQFAVSISATGVPVCAAEGDASATNEIQDVIANRGLERDATSNNFGLIASCTLNQILKWNGTGWSCAADSDSDVWATITGGIKYSGGNVGIGATLADADVDFPLTVQGDVAAGGFVTAGTVSADSGVFTRGGNIVAQSVFSNDFKYVAGERTLIYATPRCNTLGTGGKLNCDISNALLDCGSGNYSIGTDPGSAPPVCYDQYLSVENAPAKQAYTLISSETTGGWVTGNTGFGDTISIGGDSGLTVPDAEIRINAPTNRNLVSFTNPGVPGGLADIRAKKGFFESLFVAGGSADGQVLTYDAATQNAVWRNPGIGADNWGTQVAARDGTLVGDGASDTTKLGVDTIAEAARVTALADARIGAQKGVAGGVATLGTDSKIPSLQLPALAITNVRVVSSISERNALTGIEEGDVAVVTNDNNTYIWDGSIWQEVIVPGQVTSVNGETGAVTIETGVWDGPDTNGAINYNDGNVGIQVGADSPKGPLDVRTAVPVADGKCPAGYTHNDLNGNGLADNASDGEKECFANTASFIVAPDGKVGIGTNAPTAKFEVADSLKADFGGAVQVIKDLFVGLNTQLLGKLGVGPLEVITDDSADLTVKGNTSIDLGLRFLRSQNIDEDIAAENYIEFAGASNEFNVGDGVRIVDPAGLVPEHEVEVLGIVGSDKLLVQDFGGFTNNNQYQIFKDTDLMQVQNGAGTTKFIINKSGSVGIGTASPESILHIKTGTNKNLQLGERNIQGVAGSMSIVGINDAGNLNIPLEFHGSQFYFHSGNVGIGAVSPGSKLEVVGGDIKITTPQSKLILGHTQKYIQGNRSGADYLTISQTPFAPGIQFGFDNAVFGPTMTITPSGTTNNPGNVGIGTANPGAKLDVDGKLRLDTAETIDLLQMGASYRYGMGVQGAYTSIYSHNAGLGTRIGTYDGTTFTPRMTILTGGNVGIGAAAPGRELHIKAPPSGGSITMGLRLENPGGGGGTGGQWDLLVPDSWTGLQGDLVFTTDGTYQNAKVIFKNNGNVSAGGDINAGRSVSVGRGGAFYANGVGGITGDYVIGNFCSSGIFYKEVLHFNKGILTKYSHEPDSSVPCVQETPPQEAPPQEGGYGEEGGGGGGGGGGSGEGPAPGF